MQDIQVSPAGDIRLAVQVEPFDPDPTCPKCANEQPSWLLNFAREIRGQSTLGTSSLSFCPGSKPLTQAVGGIQAALTGTTEIEHACAGVETGHLHVSCGRCGYRWLMECADL